MIWPRILPFAVGASFGIAWADPCQRNIVLTTLVVLCSALAAGCKALSK